MTQITEILACIDAPHFNAGVVLWDDKVIEAAPIIGYMKKAEVDARPRAIILQGEGLEGGCDLQDAAPANLRRKRRPRSLWEEEALIRPSVGIVTRVRDQYAA